MNEKGREEGQRKVGWLSNAQYMEEVLKWSQPGLQQETADGATTSGTLTLSLVQYLSSSVPL